MMDSHILRKASYRLPALANLAVLRFNTRGTTSERGTSGGEFGGGGPEGQDVAAAIDFCSQAGLPRLWLLDWLFGTELALSGQRAAGGRRIPAVAGVAQGDRLRSATVGGDRTPADRPGARTG